MIDEEVSGYYLSAYCNIDPIGNLVNAPIRHDQNIALWKLEGNKLELLKHWELERNSGLKHHQADFFSIEDFYEYVNRLLSVYGISYMNIKKCVGIHGIDKEADVEFDEQFTYHSLCHLYSSMGVDSDIVHNGEILTLAIDGESDMIYDTKSREKYYFTGAYCKNGQISLFPISSPGILWTVVAYNTGLQEGTLMALGTASLSESYVTYELPVQIRNMEENLSSQGYMEKIIDDIMSYTSSDQGVKFNFYDERFSEFENKVSMIVKILQKWSIDLVDKNIENAIEKFHFDPKKISIALSGGYSLNCPTNTHIMHRFGFKNQYIIPCVNDGGQSIGAGLLYFYKNIKNLEFKFKSCYLGNQCDTYSSEFDYYIESIQDGCDSFADDVTDNIVVWFDGRAEIGPRALGHRSLIGDPRSMAVKNRMNEVKQRQWWRPVAPMILESECENWFVQSFPSPYMLNNFLIQPEKKNAVPAILHLDDTCRIQTVDENQKLLYEIIRLFYEKTGVPILCNTSLNDRGEPIIDTIDQALNFALRKKIEIAYINGKRYKLTHFNEYHIKSPLRRDDEIFVKYREDKAVCKKYNPYNVTEDEYNTYMNSNMEREFNFQDEKDVRQFKRMLRKMMKLYEMYVSVED